MRSDAATVEDYRSRFAAGKRLAMGKACLRFRSLDDLDLDAVAETIAAAPVEAFIAAAPPVGPR